MIVLPPETPAWAGVFINAIHPASLICAIVFPLLRLLVLKWHRLAVSTGMWIEAGAAGLSFPSFIALPLSIMTPVIRTHLDGHVLALAGGIGIIYSIASLVKIEREESRSSQFG